MRTAELAALAEEWAAANPQTPEEVAAFYRDASALAADIEEWHTHEYRASWTEAIVSLAQQAGVKSVLDVGCGRGDDLFAIHQALNTPELIRVHLAGIEPNRALAEQVYARFPEFQRPLIGEHPIDISFGTQETNPARGAELTICVDVLEHIPNPQAFLDQILARIPMGGWFVEATATMDVQNPTHLKENWGWLPDGQIRRAGFRLEQTIDPRLHIWKRVAEKGDPNSRTLILMAYRAVPPGMMQQVIDMRDAGWNVALAHNDALVTRARSTMLSHWWRTAPDDVCLFVDADITFSVEAAEQIVRLAREKRGVVVGAYALRAGQHISSRPFADTRITFGAGAEPVEIEYGATGFMAIHRDVVDALVQRLPLYHPSEWWSFWPFFDTSGVGEGTAKAIYLSEDWHFCRIAREAGFRIWLDPSIRLGHLGDYEYHLEDMQHAGDFRKRAKLMAGEQEVSV